MPSKYVVRNFTANSSWHVYNSGVDKRTIFADEKDYRFFQTYLFIYLSPLKEVLATYPDLPRRLYAKNMAKDVELIGYCLLPDHFHLFLKQKTKYGVSRLMKQMTNAYTLYFNQKYNRVGSLMQGRFKASPLPDSDITAHETFHTTPGEFAKEVSSMRHTTHE